MIFTSSLIGAFLLASSADALRGRRLNANAIHIRTLADFEWKVSPEDGFPAIDEANDEMDFQFTYTGSLGEIDVGLAPQKGIEFKLMNPDCTADATIGTQTPFTVAGAPAPSSVEGWLYNTDGASIDFQIALVPDDIEASEYYTVAGDQLSADITFCIRGDYLYDGLGFADYGSESHSTAQQQSVNFHETVVTISVDLTKNFQITTISTERTAADQENENMDIDCDASAFFCNGDAAADLDDEVAAPVLKQGDALQFCVAIAEEDKDRLWIKDIVEADLEQDNNDNDTYRESGDEYDDLVSNFNTQSILTDKDCATLPGVCKIKTQLSSKYFTDVTPKALDVFGVALCAFGKPTGGVVPTITYL